MMVVGLLMLTAQLSLATERFLAPGGTDSGAGGAGAPWGTLTYALANATSGDTITVTDGTYTGETYIDLRADSADGKTLTIAAAAGATPIFATTDTTNCIIRRGDTGVGGDSNETTPAWLATSSFSFTGITFKPSVTLSGGAGANGVVNIRATGSAAVTLSFTSCTFDTASHDSRLWREGATHTAGVYIFQDCTFNASACTSSSAALDFQNSYTSIYIDGCTFTAGQGHGLSIGKTGASPITLVTFTDSTINAASLAAGKVAVYTLLSNSSRIATFNFSRNTINSNRGGFACHGGVRQLICEDNTANITTANGGIGFQIGADSADGTAVTITNARALRNTTNYSSSAASHGVFVGRYVTRGELAYNTAVGADYGLVVKGCTYVNVHHNAAWNVTRGGIYVRGATDCFITNNSVYRYNSGITGECFGINIESIDDTGVYTDPARLTFTENLIYIADGSPTNREAGVNEDTSEHVGTTSIATCVFHRNIIRVPSGMNFAAFNGSTYATIALARTAWASYGTVDAYNQSDDSSADPLFYSLTDLRIGPASPAQGAASSLRHDAGAYQDINGSNGGSLRIGL